VLLGWSEALRSASGSGCCAFACGLAGVAGVGVDGCEVGVVVCAAEVVGGDVVDVVRSGFAADVADASVSAEDAAAAAGPVGW
jgi:hypothetical protein